METKSYNPIISGTIWKESLVFFFPILFGSIFQQIYNTADALIVGRFLGKVALSAVGGSSGMIVLLIVGFFVGLASGATVLVAQYYGAKNSPLVSKTVHTVITFSILVGVLIMIAGMIFTPLLLKWMNTPEETMDLSILYLRVYFLGMIGNMLYNVGSGVLRAVGDSRRPFYFLVFCCFLNIVLDLTFILVFHWGVFGAALATILSQTLSAILILVVMMREDDSYQLHLSRLRMDPQILKDMIRVGMPAGIQSIMYGVSNIVIQIGCNGLGTNYVAAWAIYYKIDGMFWMTVNAFGVTVATFVGQNYGARIYDRVKRSISVTMLMALAASAAISIVVWNICPWMFPFFSTDAEVNRIGVAMMHYLTRFYVLYVPIEILSGALRGAGDTLIPMCLSGVGVCLLRSLWIIIFMPQSNNMYTMMFSYPLSWVVTSLAFFIYVLFFSRIRGLYRKNVDL